MICSITCPIPKSSRLSAYLEQLHDLPLVRDGSLRVLDFDKLTGIVTFPSFHAAAAVLYLWAFWPVRWIGPLALVDECRDAARHSDLRRTLFRRRLCRHRDRRSGHHDCPLDRRLVDPSGESKRHVRARVRGPRRITACHIHVTPAKNRGRVKLPPPHRRDFCTSRCDPYRRPPRFDVQWSRTAAAPLGALPRIWGDRHDTPRSNYPDHHRCDCRLAGREDHQGGGFGLIGDIIVGIVGAFIGGWLLGRLHLPGIGLVAHARSSTRPSAPASCCSSSAW